jgi:DNA-binding transcriptional LysR family regulator
MAMEIRQLRYFLAVAEHAHFTRAAEALFVSQPALSQQIGALEREVGLPLFDRLGRRVELTSAGRVLHEHALRIVREVENARGAVDDLRGMVRGDLTVCAVQTANAGFLVDVMARFHASHPGVVVRTREERGDDVVEAVLEGRASLGLTYLTGATPDGLETVPLYEEELVLVVPAGHPLAGATVRTAEAGEMPLVVPPGGYCLRQGVDAVLAEAGARQRVVAEITAIEGICSAVRAGIGVAVLPARYILPRAEREGLAVARLVDPVPVRTIGAVRAAERHACTATRAFLRFLRDAAELPAERRTA